MKTGDSRPRALPSHPGCDQSDEAARADNMLLLLLIITGILGQKEGSSGDQESSEPWWNISKRTPHSEMESQSTTSIPALSLVRNFFNNDNSSESSNVKVTESHDNRNEEEILSPFLVNAFPKFGSDLKINLSISPLPLLPAPSFSNILDAEEIFTKHENIEDNHNGDDFDTKYLVSSLDSDVDNSEFEKRLMTRLKQLLGLSMSGETTNHGSPMHGRDFFLSF